MPRKDRKAPTLLRLPTPTISKAKPRKAGDNKTKERSWMAITAVECSLNGKASPLDLKRGVKVILEDLPTYLVLAKRVNLLLSNSQKREMSERDGSKDREIVWGQISAELDREAADIRVRQHRQAEYHLRLENAQARGLINDPSSVVPPEVIQLVQSFFDRTDTDDDSSPDDQDDMNDSADEIVPNFVGFGLDLDLNGFDSVNMSQPWEQSTWTTRPTRPTRACTLKPTSYVELEEDDMDDDVPLQSNIAMDYDVPLQSNIAPPSSPQALPTRPIGRPQYPAIGADLQGSTGLPVLSLGGFDNPVDGTLVAAMDTTDSNKVTAIANSLRSEALQSQQQQPLASAYDVWQGPAMEGRLDYDLQQYFSQSYGPACGAHLGCETQQLSGCFGAF
eukprot:m.35108 g.35108  ORF g.35108 m.35108 type:complete len:391 (+) comp10893_c0_seq1:261-1433(+)